MALSDFPRHFADRFPWLVGGRLLVALSGGADSVALLHLLRDPTLRLSLEAAHVHHQVRGAEADRDAQFCADLCRRLKIPYHLVRITIEPSPVDGREGAWRRHRYRELIALANRRSFDAVATAHQRDDIAEGVVMQLLRGAGTRALAGIAETTGARVIRPLLPWRHVDIVNWLRLRDLDWMEDSSNRDLGHLRNAVRHIVLPQLRDLAPHIDEHVVHLAEALADDESFFAAELARRSLWIDPWNLDGAVHADEVRSLAPSLRTRWLHAQAARAGIGRVTRRQIELLHCLLDEGNPRSVALAGRWRLRLARGQLWLEPPVTPAPYEHPLIDECEIELPIPGWHVRVGRRAEPSPRARWHWRAPESSRMTVRSPRPGDSVEVGAAVVGLTRLIAKVVPRHLRPAWPLFCENARIAWVPGVWMGTSSGPVLVEVLTDG